MDYGDILEQAQAECDVLIWDGGNNDLPFYAPTVHVVVADPLRAGHETSYHPGEANLRMADVIVVNKMDSALIEQVHALLGTIHELNPRATVVKANSRVTVDDPGAIAGKRVLVVEDGPTLTHGEMKFGAGVVAARARGASDIVDPRPWAIGTIDETFRKYDVGAVLPAMGYSDGQLIYFYALLTLLGILKYQRFGTGLLIYLPFAILGVPMDYLGDWVYSQNLISHWHSLGWAPVFLAFGLVADLAYRFLPSGWHPRWRSAAMGVIFGLAFYLLVLFALTTYYPKSDERWHLRFFLGGIYFSLPWMLINGGFAGYTAHAISQRA